MSRYSLFSSRLFNRRPILAVAVAIAVAVVGVGAAARTAFAEDVGSITGQLTHEGVGVSGASAELYDTGGNWVAFAPVDNAGAFSYDGVPAGDYKIRFQLGSLSQWNGQKLTFDEADIITVVAGQVTTVEEELLPHGTISGHLTDEGAPVTDASVFLYDTNGAFLTNVFVDDTGGFTFGAVLTGDYKVEFNVGGFTQWSVQKRDFADADVVTVVADQATIVEEELLPFGTIFGRFTDDGAPVANAWVTLFDTAFTFVGFAGTDEAGGFTFGVPPGDYKIQFQVGGVTQWASQKTSFDEADIVTVVAGQVTTVEEEILARGMISGHFLDNGAPVAGATVTLYDTDFSFLGSTVVDDTGAFTFDVMPGDYKLEFRVGSLVQWSAQKASFDQADVITVVAEQVTTVVEEVLPHGTISGQVTRADGTPAAFVPVNAIKVDAPFTSAFTFTDESGQYSLAYLPPGDYRVLFRKDFSSPEQWANNATSASDAARIPATAGEVTTLNQQLLPVGSISGVLTDSDGTPVPSTQVLAVDTSTRESHFAMTDGEGRYAFALFGGEYTLSFHTPYGTQWATGRSSEDLADPITVVDGDQITHNETLAPLGSVAFSAVDSVTGAPVSAFCVSVNVNGSCTETGSLAFDLLPGRYFAIVTSAGDDYLSTDTFVDVTAGAEVSVVLEFVPAAKVTTTVTDKLTGAPVANACLELVGVTSARSLGMNPFPCSDESGRVTLTHVAPGRYKAFVWAGDGAHGHQWVGDYGGVGQFGKAKTITITAGQAVTLPSIRLDAAGDITGVVTDEVTRAPVDRGSVSLSSFSSGFGGQAGMFPIDEHGRYTVSGLGPYQWELFFAVPSYAYEWSGDTGTRAKASTIKVKPGKAVTYNTSVGRGTTVTGLITDQDGTAATSAQITFVNAATGDEMAVDDTFDAPVPGRYTAQVKGPQRVKVHYFAQVGDRSYVGWIGGTTFADATLVSIPARGTLTLDITATQPRP